MPFVKIPGHIFVPGRKRQEKVSKGEKVKKCWTNRLLSLFSPWSQHMSECSALYLSQGLPGGWWVNRLTSPILPSPMGQTVFAQQHRGIQEIEEIPPLPVVLGSPPLTCHPPTRARYSLRAKGSAAYLSWLNEDGGHSHTLLTVGICWIRGMGMWMILWVDVYL